MTVRWTTWEPDHAEAYRRFARRTFGPGSYQARDAYLRWLYDHRPGGGPERKGFLLAVTGTGEVVGCIHKMPLPWTVDGRDVVIPAAHNLMVAPEHRSGLGLALIMACFDGEDHVLIPGATKQAAAIYDRLGCQQVEGSYYRKVIRPLSGGLALAGSRLGTGGARPRRFPREAPSSQGSRDRTGLRVSHAPTGDLLAALSDGMNAAACGEARPRWNPELVRWRFFHAAGPRHVLVHVEGEAPLRSFAIASLGPRRGLNVGRILGAGADTAEALASVLEATQRSIARAGGHVLIFYCGDERLDGLFQACGWTPRPDPPGTYFHHRRDLQPFKGYSVMGGAADYGFEALPEDAA